MRSYSSENNCSDRDKVCSAHAFFLSRGSEEL